MRITELIVVEGQHDEAALKTILDADIVITRGLHADEALFDVLREAVKTRGVIVFTDPDHPGQRIRQRIAEAVPGVRHAFLNAEDARGRGKVGIEHATPEALREALRHVITMTTSTGSLTRTDLVTLGLSGHPDSHRKRSHVCATLHLPVVNPKQLLMLLRARQLSVAQLREILDEKSI